VQLPPSQPPEDLPDTLQWKRIKVQAGIKRAMVLAGEPFGVLTHHPQTRTLPCFTAISGGNLRCPFCTYAKRFTVWVPILDFDDKKNPRKVVQGGRKTWHTLATYKPGDVVRIARGDGERDTITFHRAEEHELDKARLTLWRAKLPFDIRPYLFHLWQLRVVNKHFGIPFTPSLRTLEIEAGIRTIEEDEKREADV
jgi:hypothetical protein